MGCMERETTLFDNYEFDLIKDEKILQRKM